MCYKKWRANGLRHCATSREVPGSIPGSVTGDFFRGSPRRNHVPWGWLSPWKWVPGISPGVKAAGAYGWRPTALVVPNFKKIWGLNLPETPWATSACCGMTFTWPHLHLFSPCFISCLFVAVPTIVGKYTDISVLWHSWSDYKWIVFI